MIVTFFQQIIENLGTYSTNHNKPVTEFQYPHMMVQHTDCVFPLKLYLYNLQYFGTYNQEMKRTSTWEFMQHFQIERDKQTSESYLYMSYYCLCIVLVKMSSLAQWDQQYDSESILSDTRSYAHTSISWTLL